jgi:hypothetical protein
LSVGGIIDEAGTYFQMTNRFVNVSDDGLSHKAVFDESFIAKFRHWIARSEVFKFGSRRPCNFRGFSLSLWKGTVRHFPLTWFVIYVRQYSIHFSSDFRAKR